ncbi:MAG: toxin-antitoxin system YwqK family antitoxin, partial [Bacteroidales bacterium]|nr:toxin-antitoxin system YwqK family antitoxin [Bacteroidales bacterium]
ANFKKQKYKLNIKKKKNGDAFVFSYLSRKHYVHLQSIFNLRITFTMIRFISVLIISVLFLTSCSKVDKSYYENGQIKSELKFKNKKRDGKSIWYHPNGQIQMEAIYKNDVLDGTLQRYYHNGSLQLLENYKEGILHGEKKSWDDKGHLSYSANYENGKLQGKYNVYYPDEYIQIEGNYNQDNYHGKWIYYSISGQIVGEGEFENGNGTQTEYDFDGSIKKTTQYKDNLKEGFEYIFNNKGDTITTNEYQKGVLIL